MSRPVYLGGKVFPSISACAEWAGVDRSTVWRAATDHKAMRIASTGMIGEPRFCGYESEETTPGHFDVFKVKCPHCDHYHDVKVSLS